MLTVLLVFHLIIVISLVAVILLQRSEGGALGSLGGGNGLSLISGRSAGNFLTKATAVLATLFMLSCIALTIINKNAAKEENVSAVDSVSSENVLPAAIKEAEKQTPAPVPAAGKETSATPATTNAVPPKLPATENKDTNKKE